MLTFSKKNQFIEQLAIASWHSGMSLDETFQKRNVSMVSNIKIFPFPFPFPFLPSFRDVYFFAMCLNIISIKRHFTVVEVSFSRVGVS